MWPHLTRETGAIFCASRFCFLLFIYFFPPLYLRDAFGKATPATIDVRLRGGKGGKTATQWEAGVHLMDPQFKCINGQRLAQEKLVRSPKKKKKEPKNQLLLHVRERTKFSANPVTFPLISHSVPEYSDPRLHGKGDGASQTYRRPRPISAACRCALIVFFPNNVPLFTAPTRCDFSLITLSPRKKKNDVPSKRGGGEVSVRKKKRIIM